MFYKQKRDCARGPISPLLFVLIMEYFHRCMRTLSNNPDFNYHPKCERLKITNVCFAEDLLLFARGDAGSVRLMMQKFNSFSASTCLKANPTKCRIYFGGTHEKDKHSILAETSYGVGQLSFKYLGDPLSSR